ncbi:MAG: HlyD family efflux transporter periplasmic adaptor subunit [Pseudomonadota bacterium]
MRRANSFHDSPDDPLAILSREDARINTYLRMANFVLLALLVGLGGWAAMTKISGAVIADAKIAVEAKSKSVQHLEGGIVTDLAVKEGEQVQRGQLLLQLDPGQVNETIRGLRSQAQAKKAQLEFLRSELDDLNALAEKRLVPRSQLAKAKRELAELEGEYGRLSAELSRTDVNKKRLRIRAPIEGRVHGMRVHTIGGVVKPGQEVLKIVPSNAKLILEGALEPKDIDQVEKGQKVSIRLSSFNQRTTPELNGKVTSISADLVSDERRENYHYLVYIEFDENQLSRLGGRPIVPGMPASIFIQTESRTVLGYLVSPLTDQFRRAMRED